MTFAGAIFLIVVGAILMYGVNLDIAGVRENVIGLILIVAGLIGLVAAVITSAAWAARGRRGDRYYDDPRY